MGYRSGEVGDGIRRQGVVDRIDVGRITHHVLHQGINAVIGTGPVFQAAAQVHADSQDFVEFHIQIGPNPVLGERDIMGAIRVLYIQETLLVGVVQNHVVLGQLGTATDGQGGIGKDSGFSEHLVIPVHVDTVPVFQVTDYLEIIERIPLAAVVVAPSLIVELAIIQRSQRFNHIDGKLNPATGLESDDGSAFHTAFRLDENDTVGPVHAVNGQLGRILEDGDRFDLFRRDIVDKVALHLKPVHVNLERVQIRRGGIGPDSPDHHPGTSVAGRSVIGDDDQPGILTGQ